MPARCLALALLVSLAPACSSGGPLTELVVIVDADLPVPELRMFITGPDGASHVDQRIVGPSLPLSIVLTRDHAPYGPVMVHVEGAGVISDTTTELSAGERRRLDVHLTTSCLCSQCAASQTCRGGACADRHVPGTMLAPYAPSDDAGLAPPFDGGMDAGPTPDAGTSHPTCGCHGQPCCGGTMCNGTLTCSMGSCLMCTTHPTIAGMTPRADHLANLIGSGSSLSVGYADATGSMAANVDFLLQTGVSVSGMAAPVSVRLTSVSGSGSSLIARSATSMGTITFSGATVSGAFSAPATCPGGGPGSLVMASASGPTITFTACDGTSGAITLSPAQCQ